MEQKKIVNCYLFAVLVIFDQITKLIFSHRDFFVGPIHFHPMKNYGLSFALDFGLITNIILIILGLIFFVYYYRRHRFTNSKLQQSAFILIFAGAVSNIADRMYFGYVRDFLDLGLGFTFNLADVFVVAGLIIILFTQSKPKDIIET